MVSIRSKPGKERKRGGCAREREREGGKGRGGKNERTEKNEARISVLFWCINGPAVSCARAHNLAAERRENEGNNYARIRDRRSDLRSSRGSKNPGKIGFRNGDRFGWDGCRELKFDGWTESAQISRENYRAVTSSCFSFSAGTRRVYLSRLSLI